MDGPPVKKKKIFFTAVTEKAEEQAVMKIIE